MSTTKTELTAGDKHLLRLIRREKDADGWAKVSKMLWPIILALPTQLVETRASDDGGFIRLTDAGSTVLDWL